MRPYFLSFLSKTFLPFIPSVIIHSFPRYKHISRAGLAALFFNLAAMRQRDNVLKLLWQDKLRKWSFQAIFSDNATGDNFFAIKTVSYCRVCLFPSLRCILRSILSFTPSPSLHNIKFSIIYSTSMVSFIPHPLPPLQFLIPLPPPVPSPLLPHPHSRERAWNFSVIKYSEIQNSELFNENK